MRTTLAMILVVGVSLWAVSCAAPTYDESPGGYYSSPNPLTPAEATEQLRENYRREFR